MAIRAQLNTTLPEYYIARWDRYVWIDEMDREIRALGRPDAHVSDTLSRDFESSTETVLVAPAVATLPAVEPLGKPFVKIIDTRGHRVVSVIELLSHANKSGRDRDAYLAKRQETIRAGVNLVEMDFLRAGKRPPLNGDLDSADYYILIGRAGDYPKFGIWPLRVRDSLPEISVPLDPGIDPVRLSLRPCLDRAFEEGRFANDIDTTKPPIPPLTGDDATWARELLSNANS